MSPFYRNLRVFVYAAIVFASCCYYHRVWIIFWQDGMATRFAYVDPAGWPDECVTHAERPDADGVHYRTVVGGPTRLGGHWARSSGPDRETVWAPAMVGCGGVYSDGTTCFRPCLPSYSRVNSCYRPHTPLMAVVCRREHGGVSGHLCASRRAIRLCMRRELLHRPHSGRRPAVEATGCWKRRPPVTRTHRSDGRLAVGTPDAVDSDRRSPVFGEVPHGPRHIPPGTRATRHE